MAQNKTSNRQVVDQAAIERHVRVVENIGKSLQGEIREQNKRKFVGDRPGFFRGAMIKPKS